MCAINGICWEDRALILKMNAVLTHRGPDRTNTFMLSGVTLGHNRLSIIDTDERSSQPMQTADGRYTIIYNGEIYNFKELRNKLRNFYEFETESDTEVILLGFKKWGKHIFNHLNGMYALAIYDAESGVITLARDPMGIKPLYITKTPKGFAFSSEIKALLEIGIPRKINRQSFDAYMRTLYVPAPFTMFSGVDKFPQGMVGEIKGTGINYFQIQYEAVNEPLSSNNIGGVREAVEQAVERQLVSDRPLGVYLSGGVDSSAVLAAATKAGGNMDTYSIGFELGEEEESEKFNADSVLAKKIARHFGARHHEFYISPREVLNLFEHATYHLDEPVANATIAAQVALSKSARDSVVVALTGDGGDEVFGGYPRYLLNRRMGFYQTIIPSVVSNLLPNKLKKMGVKSLEDRFALFHFQKDAELSRVLTSLPQQLVIQSVKEAKTLMEADRKTWLIDEALLRSDKLAMANGLETRPPLLDLELMHQMSAIPFEKQVSLFETKILLKKAFRSELPDWILSQPKRGWFAPGAKWLRHETLKEDISQILAPGYAPATDALFNWDGVHAMYTEHVSKKSYHATALLSVLMFQLWSREFKISV